MNVNYTKKKNKNIPDFNHGHPWLDNGLHVLSSLKWKELREAYFYGLKEKGKHIYKVFIKILGENFHW